MPLQCTGEQPLQRTVGRGTQQASAAPVCQNPGALSITGYWGSSNIFPIAAPCRHRAHFSASQPPTQAAALGSRGGMGGGSPTAQWCAP